MGSPVGLWLLNYSACYMLYAGLLGRCLKPMLHVCITIIDTIILTMYTNNAYIYDTPLSSRPGVVLPAHALQAGGGGYRIHRYVYTHTAYSIQ
jgi:hypothetical protein